MTSQSVKPDHPACGQSSSEISVDRSSARPMQRIAVFGKPAGGKSTLSKAISAMTGIPLHHLDLIEYDAGGAKAPEKVYLEKHAALLSQDCWLIEGFGTLSTFRQRLADADTLVYVDRPLWQHYWWSVKRFLLSAFKKPEGWPQKSPMVRSTLTSWRNLSLGRKVWTNEFRRKIESYAPQKNVYVISSDKDLRKLINDIKGQRYT